LAPRCRRGPVDSTRATQRATTRSKRQTPSKMAVAYFPAAAFFVFRARCPI
jgi:hypothetical protein